LRPPNKRELEAGAESIVTLDETSTTISLALKNSPPETPKSFSFDRIFSWDCAQEDVFEFTAAPLLK
jgi:hypothetical protein